MTASNDTLSLDRDGRVEAPDKKLVLGLIVIAALVLASLTWILPNYYLFLGGMVLSYGIALLGLNILTGYNGQISLGHGAFMAIGGYTAAIAMEFGGIPYWATLPLAGILCLTIGYLFGFPALRLGGFQLALATFALAIALPQFLKWKNIEEWTGGVQGIVLMKPDAPFGMPLNPDQWLYLFSLIVALFFFWIGWNLLRGRIGRALVATRDQSIAASAMGVNIAQYKSLAFGISALYTGVSGALIAILVQYVSPDSYGFYLSVSLLTGIVVGGLASFTGAIYGALFIVFVPNIAESISKSAPWAIYGVMMIATVYLLPTGAAGLVAALRQKLSK